MINGEVSPSQNVLITGAGGGVAILAIQLCIAKGANVYVTSGSDEKIGMAMKLGAKAGVNYRSSRCLVLCALEIGSRSDRQRNGLPSLQIFSIRTRMEWGRSTWSLILEEGTS